MKATFSPLRSVFYFQPFVDDGSYGESLPDDLIEPTDDELATFWRISPPAGRALGTVSGRPAWVDLPPLTPEEIISHNTATKITLLDTASRQIDLLIDATNPDVMGDDIDHDDVTRLNAWKAYRVKVSRITDMLKPAWPDLPA